MTRVAPLPDASWLVAGRGRRLVVGKGDAASVPYFALQMQDAAHLQAYRKKFPRAESFSSPVLEEAFALADRIAIMDAGICRQIGKPAEVYNRPADKFVAQFLGKANLLPGNMLGMAADVVVMVRPENVVIASPTGRGWPHERSECEPARAKQPWTPLAPDTPSHRAATPAAAPRKPPLLDGRGGRG